MAFNGGEFVVSGTATSITTALGLTRTLHAKQIIVQNAIGAANTLFVGRSTVTTTTNRHHSLAAGQAVVIGGGDWKALNTDEVFVVGTVAASNIAFFIIIE